MLRDAEFLSCRSSLLATAFGDLNSATRRKLSGWLWLALQRLQLAMPVGRLS
jgi:hypothetical protein